MWMELSNNKCVSFTYIDVDECSGGSNKCDQTCTNTEGSYTCSCNSGYTLSSDGRSCNGMYSSSVQFILHTTEPSNTLGDVITILQFQILMNAAHQVLMTVTMSVPTLKAPTHVPVTVDILCVMMGNRAILMSLMMDVEGDLLHPVAVSIHQDIPMVTHRRSLSVNGKLK